MVDVTERLETATDHVAEVAAEIVEGAVVDTAAALDTALERAEAAEDAAEDLAAAMLQTRIGETAAQALERANTCHENLSQLERTMIEKMEAISSQLTALQTPQPQVLLTPQPSTETTEEAPIAEEAETVLEAVTVVPLANVVAEAAPAAPVRKPTRWT